MSRKDNKGRVLKKGESQRKDGTYMYRWTDACKKRQCIYSKTLNDLRDQENILNTEIINGVSRKNITLNNQIELYLNTKANITPATDSNYRYYYKHLIKDNAIGNMLITNIKKSHILMFYKYCHDKGLSNSSIAILQKIIRPSLQLAVDSDIIMKNSANGCVKEYSVLKEIKYALSVEEEQELLHRFDIIESVKYYKTLACLLLYTGMRISELLGLTWDDVDMETRQINVNHQMICRNVNGKLLQYCSSNTKTVSGTRVIPMNNLAYENMLEQRKKWMASKKVPGFSIDGYSNFVFLNPNTGRVVRHSVIRRVFRRVVKEGNETREIQLPTVSPHILRHTYCTRLAEAGTELKAMQYLMGHSEISTTMEVYNHVNKYRLEKEVEKINSLHQIYTKTS